MDCLRPSGRAEEISLVGLSHLGQAQIHEITDLEPVPAGISDGVVSHTGQSILQIVPPLLRDCNQKTRSILSEQDLNRTPGADNALDLIVFVLEPDSARQRHLRKCYRLPAAR